jgi:DNA repair protein RadA/Sms
MKKSTKNSNPLFVCTECGQEHTKWLGQCHSCKAWNSLVEFKPSPAQNMCTPQRGLGQWNQSSEVVTLNQIEGSEIDRLGSGNTEFDRAIGGGFAPGALCLIGGDPGIGKSTLLLTTAATMATAGVKCLYVTGEESADQVKLRANRLAVGNSPLLLLCETDLQKILKKLEEIRPEFLVIDSIQTLYKSDVNSAPGTVTQIRECTLDLMIYSKSTGCVTVLVGHVTKDGNIAGPKILEHMVDTVVYFEGDRNHQFRLFRTIKNRFGAAGEIGVFEMSAVGLIPIENPSLLFMNTDRDKVPGSVSSCTLEGTRSLLFEIQALVSGTQYAIAQRVCVGLDPKRLTIMLALLDKFGGIHIGNADVFVTVVGGLKIDDPSADLALAMAIASNHLGRGVEPQTLIVGELGLAGEVRIVAQIEARLKEAHRLGFKKALVPELKNHRIAIPKGLEIIQIKHISQALMHLE